MRKYLISSLDDATGMEILLDRCSYNNACCYLKCCGFNWSKAQIKVDYRTNRTLIYEVNDEGSIQSRVFLYDENRGLLLGDI